MNWNVYGKEGVALEPGDLDAEIPAETTVALDRKDGINVGQTLAYYSNTETMTPGPTREERVRTAATSVGQALKIR